MHKQLLALILFLGCTAEVSAQKLAIPTGIQKAYDKGTRSTNGRPGKKYWENHGHYNIQVTMTPPNKTISGVEQITYFNNSPDKLDSLNMKLIVNVHRSGRGNAPANPAAGISVDNILINGAKAEWDNNTAITTNYMIGLKKP